MQRVAETLANAKELAGAGVTRPLRALFGAMAQHQPRSAPVLAAMLAPFHKVPRSYWPGLCNCYDMPELPRTNNALAQLFGAHRYHERRATGHKGASPTLVLRGSGRIAACAATRLRSCASEELAPGNPEQWQALQQQLAPGRQQRGRRYRFRRNPEVYLAALEKDLLQISLPT